jgi:hypothetical protein
MDDREGPSATSRFVGFGRLFLYEYNFILTDDKKKFDQWPFPRRITPGDYIAPVYYNS